MKVREWEVWYTYATRFIDFPTRIRPDEAEEASAEIVEAAHRLCESGLCPVVYVADGGLFWKGDSEVKGDWATIERVGHADIGTMRLPPELNERRPYLLETAGQALQMRFLEETIFSDFVLETLPYLRGYLDLCTIGLADGEALVQLYPHIKLYPNGVLLLSFRVLSPNEPVRIENIVEHYVNLFRHNTTHVHAPPEVLKWSARDTVLYMDDSIVGRYGRLDGFREVIDNIDEATYEEEFGEFTHTLVSMDPEGILQEERLNLDSLRNSIFEAVSGVLNQPREGKSYVLRGQEEKEYQIGNSWTGRPHVYLLDYEGQPETASEIRDKHGPSMGRVLSRMPHADDDIAFQHLTDSLRPHEDYNIHFNRAVGLWVYSQEGVEKRTGHEDDGPWPQSEVNDLIFGEQVKMEFMDFVHQTYRSLEERAFQKVSSVSSAHALLEERIVYDKLVERPAVYGEIMNMYDSLWDELEMSKIESSLDRNVDLSLKQADEVRGELIRKFGWVLTIIVGIASAQGLASSLIRPVWVELELWVPAGENLRSIFFYTLAAVTIVLVASGTWQLLRWQVTEER